jgi:hypothetical protein
MSARLHHLLIVVVLTTVVPSIADVSAAASQPRGAPPGPTYVPPVVDAVIVDHFRAPATAYSAGNRGIDELSAPGAPVVASAGGDVVFAGSVAGTLHVTLRHPDGLRTSYSFLARVLVQPGDHVEQGTVIGLSAGGFHFGVRAVDGTYLDPEALLAGQVGAHLVPGPDEGADRLREADERGALQSMIDAGRRTGRGLTTRLEAIGHEMLSADGSSTLLQLTLELERWHRSQEHCTPPGSQPPPVAGRRVAVLVGGLGSSTTTAAVDQVDLAGLGYAPSDVVRFSFRGGRVPRSGPAAVGPLESVPAHGYAAPDTEIDLHQSADALLDLLALVAAAEPGVPIDIIAHSQGGVVARLALSRADAEGRLPSGLGIVATLGTPHQGADLATAAAAIGPASPNGQVLGALAEAGGLGLDPGAPSIAQLSETSSVAAELARPVPSGVHLLSIGASGDLTVPAVRTQTPGADQAVIHLGGTHAHDQLPAAPATTRELRLALGGLRPTCSGLIQGMGDIVEAHAIARAEDGVGLALALAP